MSNVNFVRGLHRIRATYPIQFDKDAIETPSYTSTVFIGALKTALNASFLCGLEIFAKSTAAYVGGGLYGLMVKVQNSSTGAQTGANITQAGEFNCIIDSTVTNHQEAYSLCLKMTNNSNINGVAAYLRIRDAGSSMADYFFNAPNWSPGTKSDGEELFTTNTDNTPSHGLRVMIAGVSYWFLMTNVHA